MMIVMLIHLVLNVSQYFDFLESKYKLQSCERGKSAKL